MLIATGVTQSLLLVTLIGGIVLPVGKMLASGVTVSDNYNPFAYIARILIYRISLNKRPGAYFLHGLQAPAFE